MTAILGISAFYHDSAAALVVDDRIIAAAQEERFTRRKHDASFPEQAVQYCLNEAGLSAADLDYVGFYEKPLLKFDRLLRTSLAVAPQGVRSFSRAIPVWLREKLHLPRILRKHLPGYRKRFVFPSHHESHAASAFFPSPFESSAILTVDGVGEWATATIGVGQGNRISLTHELRFPHSLGLLYTAFTAYCGFQVNSGEYKLMGLAPYGEPRFRETILRELIDLKDDGSFRLDMRYFNYCRGLTMTTRRFHRLFGGPPRDPESPMTEREIDVAASVQSVTEEIMLRMARHVHRQTQQNSLCLAGGVALNCVANGRLLREGPFESIWIQPAAGDAGGALGVALFIRHQLLQESREALPSDSMQGALLGPAFDREAIMAALRQFEVEFEHVADEETLCHQVATLLADGNVVGWFQGRMEFGPRALGNRSILGDPRDPSMQSRMNEKVKFRESFRPFAPAVLARQASEYFDMPSALDSPYMLLVAPVRTDDTAPPDADADAVARCDLLARVRQIRSRIPAVTHVDHSARVQSVDAERNPRFHRLIECFTKETGCPVVINTSFNIRGEPIVCTPDDALRCFLATNMDALAIGDFLLMKSRQRHQDNQVVNDYLTSFELD